MIKHRYRSILAMFLTLLMLTILIPSNVAAADTSALTESQAIELLQSYSIVRGDPDRGLNLTDNLTRAQAAALFVRAMGAEELAKVLVDIVPFRDGKGHWAAGEIAMANRLGLMNGDGDGTFRPNAQITYAEILTVLLRIIEREPTGPWQRSVIMAEANRLGLMPYEAEATAPAIRGKVFWSLALAFTNAPLPSGELAIQKYLDHTAPVLAVDQQNTSTSDANITISGTARGASKVIVARQPALLDNVSGRFTTSITLTVGMNVIQVEAIDPAGNKTTGFVTVERRAAATRIEITGPATVQTGSSTSITVAVYDSQGRQMANPQGLTARLSNGLATFDLNTYTLKANSTAGRETLTLAIGDASRSYSFDITGTSSRVTHLSIVSINGGRTPAVDRPFTVTVHALDASGNRVTDDNWRSISLSTNGMTGVTVTPAVAQTQSGQATFTVTATTRQTGLLSVSSPGLNGAEAVVNIMSGARVVLRSNQTTLRPDGSATASISAVLQNENGQSIPNNTDSDIRVTLNTTGTDGVLSGAVLTILRNASSSNQQVTFRAGLVGGQAIFTGSVTSGHSLSVEGFTLPITDPQAAVKLQVITSNSRPAPGTTVAVTVRVLDAQDRVVQTGSYAFQIALSTTAGDRVTNGMPEGVQLTFPNSQYRPVDDGRVPSDVLNDLNSVVGRTYEGTATLHLSYNKSGVVRLTPQLVAVNNNAYHPAIGLGMAASTTHLVGVPVDVNFAGTPSAIKLTVDSLLGNDQPGGSTLSGRTMTVKATVVDAGGAVIPGYSETITLTRSTSGNMITAFSGPNRKPAVNGTADFTITTSGTTGFDLYTATVGSLTSPTVAVLVQNQAPPDPTVVAIRGIKEGGLSPSTGYVGPDADYMDIQLQSLSGNAAPQQWAIAKVYRKGESGPFFTSGAIDLKSPLPLVRVPKSALRSGRYTYEVVLSNGAGDSGRSPDQGLSEAVVASYNTGYRVVSALYDASSGKLTVNTSGLPADGTIDLTKLSFAKENDLVNLGGSTMETQAASSFTVTLGSNALLIQPDRFNGVVYLRAEEGWFKSRDGSQTAPALLQSATIKPMSVISHATLDQPARKLHLHGSGFTHGTLALDLIKIAKGEQAVPLRIGTNSADVVASTSESQISITLSQATTEALAALPGPDLWVTADAGWLSVTSGGQTYKAGAITGPAHRLYTRAAVSSVQYDRSTKTLVIRGSGFTGAVLRPELLAFRTPGSTTVWRPAASNEVTVTDDGTLQLHLDTTDANTFETRFSSASVFMNADAGWLQDSQQRWAAAPSADSVLFMVPAP